MPRPPAQPTPSKDLIDVSLALVERNHPVYAVICGLLYSNPRIVTRLLGAFAIGGTFWRVLHA